MNTESQQQIAHKAAYQIAACWRSGKFRKAGGVIAGMEPIIRSAMKHAAKQARQEVMWLNKTSKSQPQPNEEDAFAAQPRHIERITAVEAATKFVREWHGIPNDILIPDGCSGDVQALYDKVVEHFDAALTAERQCREQAEKWLDEKREESAAFQADSSKYYNRLLSALAAIDDAIRRTSVRPLINVDLSLLHEHDAEIIADREAHFVKRDAEVRKPLVDALKEARYVIASLRSFVLSGESLTATDEQTIQTMFATIDALTKQ